MKSILNNSTFLSVRTVLAQPTTRVAESLLISFITFIAISTLFLMIGLYFKAKFLLIAWIILLIAILASVSIVSVAIFKSIELNKWKRTDVYSLSGVLIVSLCGAILSTSINRPDVDDSIYAPNAVFYTENPGAPIEKSVNWIASPDKTPSEGLLQYYELSQAVFSSILGINYLDVYHIIFPGVVGFFICMSMLLLLIMFGHNHSTALISMLFFILLLLALGETHRTYGNISFARAFHGKFMFLTVGVTSWVYFSLRFFLMRDWISWIVLLALGVGMAGTTSTAMPLLPLLSIVIVVSYYINEGKLNFSVPDMKLALMYFASLIPLVIMAIDFRIYALQNIGFGSSGNSGFPPSFYGQFRLLTNSDYPLTLVTFISAFVVVILLSGYRKFFISWVFIVFIFLLNPIVSNFVMENITTENIYWRLFYILPFPLMVCVAFSILINGRMRSKAIAFFLFLAFIPLAFWGPTSVLRPGNSSTFEFPPRHKIGADNLTASREIIDLIPSGTMFAPLELSSQILIMSSHYPQFHMRNDFLQRILVSIGHINEFHKRSNAYEYLYGESNTHVIKMSSYVINHLIASTSLTYREYS